MHFLRLSILAAAAVIELTEAVPNGLSASYGFRSNGTASRGPTSAPSSGASRTVASLATGYSTGKFGTRSASSLATGYSTGRYGSQSSAIARSSGTSGSSHSSPSRHPERPSNQRPRKKQKQNKSNGQESSQQSSMKPAVHWNQPVNSVKNLAPSQDQAFYYTFDGSADASKGHTFASMTCHTMYPTVVLAYSNFIASVTCKENSIYIGTTDSKSLDFINNSWSPISNLVIATLAQGCSKFTDQYTFYKIGQIIIDRASNSLWAKILEEIDIGEHLAEVDVSWGDWKPRENGNYTSPWSSGGNGRPMTSYGGPRGTGRPGPTATRSGSSGPTSSSSPNKNETCGKAPSEKIDGFYTADCGSPTFDRDIDQKIGFFDFTGDITDELESFAPGLEYDYEDATADDFESKKLRKRALARHRLRRRGAKAFLVGLGRGIKNGLTTAYDKTRDAISTGVKAGVQAGDKALTFISDTLAVTPSLNKDLPINIGPDNTDTVFGRAKEIYSTSGGSGAVTGDLTLYCVECGVQGQVKLAGNLRWTIRDGLQAAVASFTGGISAGLQIGVVANAAITKKDRVSLISQGIPIPGISVTNVFSIGPILTLDAEYSVGLELAGKALAGLKVNIPDFYAVADLKVPANSKIGGFTPQTEKIFKADVAITAKAGLAMPLGISLGVDIPPIKFRKTAGIYEKPALEATIKYETSVGGGVDGEAAQGTCPNGIDWSIKFVNTIYADLFDIAQYPIGSPLEIPLAGDCVKLGGGTGGGETDPENPDGDGETPGTGDGDGEETGGTGGEGGETGGEGGETGGEGGETGGTGGGEETPEPEGKRRRSLALQRLSRRQDEEDEFSYLDVDGVLDDEELADLEETSDQALAYADSLLGQTSSGIDGDEGGEGEEDDEDYVFLDDETGTLGLYNDETTGNLYVTAAGGGSFFATIDDVVYGDETGNYFYYYPNVFAAYGVSRIRSTNEDTIPGEADIIGLAPVDLGDGTKPVYSAASTTGTSALTVVCDIQDQDSKVFLVNDLDAGIEKLKEEKLRYTVTGGIVEDCYYAAFVATAA